MTYEQGYLKSKKEENRDMREDVIETSKSPNKREYTPDERGEAAYEENKEDSSAKEKIRVLKL